MNKRIFSLLAMVWLSISAWGQAWQTDFDAAKSEAHEQQKKLIMVFQGSDWCAPCMKLEQEIWSSKAFQTYASQHYVMVKVDFPRKKANALSPEQQKRNSLLAETYNKNGYFPLVVILDPEGKVIGETGYKHLAPDDYISHLNSF